MLLNGATEADGFNRLVLRAGLDWKECWLLRAMFRWLKQVNLPFAQNAVEAALAAHPKAARLLVEMFHRRFDPARTDRDETALHAEWGRLLDRVENPDEDRILSRLRSLLDAMLRTNYYQSKDYLAFKLDSARAGDMPAPRPWREIFVHSVRMEGCHMRAGPVARGGIRWSDRREDFRTEILGLMKAQRMKNVIIVPTRRQGRLRAEAPATRRRPRGVPGRGLRLLQDARRGMWTSPTNYVGTDIVTAPGIVRR